MMMRSAFVLAVVAASASAADAACGGSGSVCSQSLTVEASTCAESLPATWEACCYMTDCRTMIVGVDSDSVPSPDELDDPSTLSPCKNSWVTSTVLLNVNFPSDQGCGNCCKECSCYGDPECVSFNGTKDLWIPCDARVIDDPSRDKCRMYRDKCESIKGPNDHSCSWIRPGQSDSKGWNIGKNGSPCIPDPTKGNITMDMVRSDDITVQLFLGERGVIDMIEMVLGARKYSLSAEDCFSKSGADSWTGLDGILPGTWAFENPDSNRVLWTINDTATNSDFEILCINDKKPRMNINKVRVPSNLEGTGFCPDGSISEKSGTTDRDKDRHDECLQFFDPHLQACKMLVEPTRVMEEVPACGQEFCSRAFPRNDLLLEECRSGLSAVEAMKQATWLKWYCKALDANGMMPVDVTSLDQCEALVEEKGWAETSEEWGIPFPSLQVSGSVAPGSQFLRDYPISKKAPCEEGVYIEFADPGSDDWEPIYFIPRFGGPAEALLIRYSDEPRFFEKITRVRQCNPRNEVDENNVPLCNSISKCKEVASVNVEFNRVDPAGLLQHSSEKDYLVYSGSFTNSAKPRSLLDLRNEDAIKCEVRVNADGDTSEDWCLPSRRGDS